MRGAARPLTISVSTWADKASRASAGFRHAHSSRLKCWQWLRRRHACRTRPTPLRPGRWEVRAARGLHPLPRPRLKACTGLMLANKGKLANSFLGSPDDMEFRSCMTLSPRSRQVNRPSGWRCRGSTLDTPISGRWPCWHRHDRVRAYRVIDVAPVAPIRHRLRGRRLSAC